MQDPQKELSLAGQAYQVLRTAILRCELEPGAKLRVDALQRSHGLSSSPLREALNRLVSEHLVQADEGRGFSVATISAEELRDLTRMRLLTEVEALRRSVESGDDAWEASVVAASHRLSRVEQRLGDSLRTLDNEWSARHRDFHMALLSGCGSPRLLHLCGNLFDEGERYRRLSARYREGPRKKSQEHQDLMEAALARDVQRAAELLSQHISQTVWNVEAAMARRDAELVQAASLAERVAAVESIPRRGAGRTRPARAVS